MSGFKWLDPPAMWQPENEGFLVAPKIAAWDIEVASLWPGEEFDRERDMLGITVSSFSIDNGAGFPAKVVSWTPIMDASGTYAVVMDQGTAILMALDMINLVHDGNIIVSWNGTSFDFAILLHYIRNPRLRAAILHIILHNHIDVGFCILNSLGYMLGLDRVAKACYLGGKVGMTGKEAPEAWTQGRDRQEEVIRYCENDAETTRAVFRHIEKYGGFAPGGRGGNKIQPVQLATPGWLMGNTEQSKTAKPGSKWDRANFVGWVYEAIRGEEQDQGQSD